MNIVDDWNGVELGPEVIALALVPARFKWQHKQGRRLMNLTVE